MGFTQLINVKPKSVFFHFQTVLASLLTLREIVTKYARISCILPVCNFREKTSSLELDINHISHRVKWLVWWCAVWCTLLVNTEHFKWDCHMIWPHPPLVPHMFPVPTWDGITLCNGVRNIIGNEERVCILQNIPYSALWHISHFSQKPRGKLQSQHLVNPINTAHWAPLCPCLPTQAEAREFYHQVGFSLIGLITSNGFRSFPALQE